MRINLYLDRGTLLHRLHPQVKLAILAATFASIYAIDRPLAVAPVAATLGGLLVGARAFANVRRFSLMFVAVPIASFIMWSLFYGYGQSNAAVFATRPRYEAYEFAAGMALKLESFLVILLCVLISALRLQKSAHRGIAHGALRRNLNRLGKIRMRRGELLRS